MKNRILFLIFLLVLTPVAQAGLFNELDRIENGIKKIVPLAIIQSEPQTIDIDGWYFGGNGVAYFRGYSSTHASDNSCYGESSDVGTDPNGAIRTWAIGVCKNYFGFDAATDTIIYNDAIVEQPPTPTPTPSPTPTPTPSPTPTLPDLNFCYANPQNQACKDAYPELFGDKPSIPGFEIVFAIVAIFTIFSRRKK